MVRPSLMRDCGSIPHRDPTFDSSAEIFLTVLLLCFIY